MVVFLSFLNILPTPTTHNRVLPGFPHNSNPVMAKASEADKPSSAKSKRVAVVGAGVSGLAAAYKLKSHGLNVTLFEADKRAGGKIRTVAKDGFIWDEGANTMTEGEKEVTSLLDDLKLREKQQFPISQHKRYIARDGLPVLIPSSPMDLLESNILTLQSKFKILMEPFLWRKRDAAKVSDEHDEESVGEFFERHFGKEFVDYLIDPFVAGTSGGDPHSLSMHLAFPELWNLEKRYGSIIAGAIKSKLSKKEKDGGKGMSDKKSTRHGSFSFHGGMQTLVDSICDQFSKDELKLGSKVLSLSYSHKGMSASENWSLSSMMMNGASEERAYDAVVMTAPLDNVKDMQIVKGGNPFSLDFIPEVSYVPISVMITAFKKRTVKRPLEGFGVLIPSKEQNNGLKTLGTLFSSMMFPDRAPSDLHLYTTFIGGTRNRELAKASADELKKLVCSDLHRLLGVEGEPTFVSHLFWSKAFPLYGHNYDSVVKAIDKMERDLPGFFYAGNNKDGLSVGKAIASGWKAAELIISYLDNQSDANMHEENK